MGSRDKLEAAVELERSFVSQDKQESERLNSKNAVEEYIYEIRSKIHEELEAFVTEEERSKFSMQLEDAENWLYEDGEVDRPQGKGRPDQTKESRVRDPAEGARGSGQVAAAGHESPRFVQGGRGEVQPHRQGGNGEGREACWREAGVAGQEHPAPSRPQ